MCEKLLHCWYDLICQSTHTLLIIHCPGCCLSKIQLNPYLINYLRKIGQRIFLWFIDIFKYVLDSTYSWMFYPLSFFLLICSMKSLIKHILILYFLCVVFGLHVYLHQVFSWYLKRPEEGIVSPETVATIICEWCYGYCELTWFLWKSRHSL